MTDKKAAPQSWREAIEPKHVNLREDAALAQATGGPVGHVDIGGQSLPIRCATYADLDRVHVMVGKNPMLGDFNIARDATPHQLASVVAMALTPQAEIATKLEERRNWVLALPITQHLAMLEIATCFLSVLPL